MAPAPIPPDVQALLDQLTANGLAAAALERELAPEQLRWRPAAAARSIAQVIDHRGVGDRADLEPLRKGLDEARGRGWTRREPARPNWLERKFIYSLEP